MTDEEFYLEFCNLLNNPNYDVGERDKQVMKLIARFRNDSDDAHNFRELTKEWLKLIQEKDIENEKLKDANATYQKLDKERVKAIFEANGAFRLEEEKRKHLVKFLDKLENLFHCSLGVRCDSDSEVPSDCAELHPENVVISWKEYFELKEKMLQAEGEKK